MDYTALKDDLDFVVDSITMNTKVVDIVSAILSVLQLHNIETVRDGAITQEAADQFTLVFGDTVGRILLLMSVDGRFL